jgi:iron complex outermembrane recepter protein
LPQRWNLRYVKFIARPFVWLNFCLLPLAGQTPSSAPQHETVIVTGVFEPIPLEDADRAVTVVNTRKLELLSGSIPDLLRLEPSVDLRERGPNGTQVDISIRGGTFGQTLVLVDGFRMNDAQTGHHNFDLPLPMESLSQIDIMRGSGSTMYGSDAVGGVVNFVTRKPEATEVRLRGAVGNFGINQESVTVSFLRGRFAEQLAASRDFSSGFHPDRDYRNLALFSSTSAQSGWGATRITLAHNDRPFGADQFYGPFNSWEHTRTWLAGIRQDLGRNTVASFAYRRHSDDFVLFRDQPQIYENRHYLEGYQVALRRTEHLGENFRLFYGAEGYGDSIVSNNLGTHTRGRGAGYVSFDARALKRFSFQAGAREEVYHGWQGQFSPMVSGGYWLNSRAKLRAGIHRAFRMPSLTDLYYHDPANQGSPDLRPERAWTYEAGIDGDLGHRIRGELTYFQRNESDVIDYARSAPNAVWQATNIQSLHFRGIEAAVLAPVTRSHEVEVRYTGMRGFRDPFPGVESRYAFSFPVNSGMASWRVTLPLGLIAGSRVGIVERYGHDDYGLWDFYLARASGRIHPFVQLTNLTNTYYEIFTGVPMPGRTIVAGIEIVAWRKNYRNVPSYFLWEAAKASTSSAVGNEGCAPSLVTARAPAMLA